MRTLAFILILVMIWTVGLFAFAARVARSTPAEEPQAADGVVALTGPSALRIAAAMKLLEDGKAKRLLVSGVNRKASRADIRSVAKAPGRLYDCCVDLGFSAADTIGNARETAAWARANHFKSLIVVTADYHMPRALLELKGALPEGKLQAYPVATDEIEARRWWASGWGARRMVVEYCKYLVILTRESILQVGNRSGAPSAPAASAATAATVTIRPASEALSHP
jgi:uncharacterized SAM-binding protein YcdF (DUF218 family)